MNAGMHHVTRNKIVSIQQDLTNVFKKENSQKVYMTGDKYHYSTLIYKPSLKLEI